MKQFMVMLAVLPLLLIFTIQATMDQLSSARINYIETAVYNAKEKAKQEGCFTEEIREALAADIERLGVETESISINAYSNEALPKARGEYIDYELSVDLGEMMAGRGFFRISRDENRFIYELKSRTVSEYAGR